MSIHLKKIFFFLLVSMGLFYQDLNAQQDSQYSQYMYNTVSINPGYAGSRGMLSTFGMYRNQWVGLEGAPETLNFSLNTPIGLRRVGLGLNFVSDRIGPSSEDILTADFSYSIPVFNAETKLSFGLKAGLNMFNLDMNKLDIENPNDINLVSRNLTSPVVGLGFYLHSTKWYFGLSTPNMLETEHYDEIAVSTASEKMHMYAIGGYVFDLNQDVKLKPAFLLKAVSGAPLAVDISANLQLYDQFTLGAAYRLDAAVSALAAFNLSDQIMVGYAYDYDTTPLTRYHSGTHEIFLRFELGTKIRNSVNPRFF
ncbi:hypothetical protein APR41_15245 [Salegentibacter salinarum]|uniref:Type IX secretion system membrane protein PorP/SprF n=1 Tax=Salegentibacter salinarum TaxID=447422 RepID=A0A2N0TZ56_9FLAO|nr:type IX secretion system membrane protein PorP/SprF [Salegentibacter salinarum]PKD20025.1 hypothetical protein APR41_15245 [Salegentibacter salinarum]SKC01220.1 type IX secretion system membrane protein, PorP/SprF family [Salegentibacter salinarum]